MIAQNFSYTIESEGTIKNILLTKNSTGEIKKFVTIDKSETGLRYLMDSLTDDQCESYFTKRKNTK